MSRILHFILTIWILGFPSLASAGADKDSHISLKVKRLIAKSGEHDLNIGIYVKDLTDGSTKFAYHTKRFFTPASVAKIFTAYEVLSYLGPDYRFETNLLSDGIVSKNGVLKSDLYIKFSGDPSFTYEDLKSMFAEMKLRGITGDIVVDSTIFDEQHSAPGGFTWDDNNFYYAAPGAAIIIDKNSSKAAMSPSLIAGTRAKLKINEPDVLKIENNVDSVRSGTECVYKSRYLGENKYEVYGCMVQKPRADVGLVFALRDNNLMARDYISKAIKELSIQLDGQIRFGQAQDDLATIYSHKSTPLSAIIKDTVECSCNISAASIFKHVAAKYSKKQATHDTGEAVMRSILRKDGLDGSFTLKDGAGESRYNLVTPYVVVNLLELAYKNPGVKDVFVDSLAKYGSEGTLKSRDIGKKFNSYTYGKTGTLSGSSTIAGYHLPPKGRKYAFAILVDNYMIAAGRIKQLEDQILHAILNEGHD